MASRSNTVSGKKIASSKDQTTKKRPALASITNRNGQGTSFFSAKPMVPCLSKIAKTKNELPSRDPTIISSTPILPEFYSLKSNSSIQGGSESCTGLAGFDSFRNPKLEHEDDSQVLPVHCTEGKQISSKFDVSYDAGKAGEELHEVEIIDKIAEVQESIGPQFSPTIVSDIYKYLRTSEANNRPSIDYMEKVQTDIDFTMRAILINWLVEVAEEYKLLRDTLYLAVNYVDRYLSGKVINRRMLQLLGVTCMMIAAKYEEISAPHVEEFCYITDNSYVKKEILEMESAVLDYMNFEMTAPTAICFLRRFVSIAQETTTGEVSLIQFECMASYITELSLLQYDMLCYSPSLIAASATFLAKYILSPLMKPWNPTLRSYTNYRALDLLDCVEALHHLCRCGGGSSLPAIRDKYSHHAFKFVAKKYCPKSVPPEYFEDESN